METQRIIYETLVSSADAIKRLNEELLSVQEAIANKTIEKDKDDLIQHETFGKQNKIKCRYYNEGHCKYNDRCKYVHSKHIC